MPPFDRAAAMIAALDALSANDINDTTELQVYGGAHHDPLIEEIREAVRQAVRDADQPDAAPSLPNLTSADIVDDGNIIGQGDNDVLTTFLHVRAAHEFDLDALPDMLGRDSTRTLDVLGYVLNEVYVIGVQHLLDRITKSADDAEFDDEEAEGTDEDEVNTEDDTEINTED
jgi:hypothetical protein